MQSCSRIAAAGGVCQHHIMQARRSAGLCANCGKERARRPVMNSLTGLQLRRKGSAAWEMVCVGCGRVQSWGGA